jgi:SAM-dependent methyltransferase
VDSLPGPAPDIWGEEDNARRYDAFARQYPNYRETSRDLIAVALSSADGGVVDAAVLDLACGTGATTREILAVLGPAGRVIGVDKSAAMLGVAARSTADARATWIQAPAESVDQHVAAPVDAVICNSAIWQTDIAATATAVRAVMRAGGLFAFNVPVGFLADGAHDASRDRYPSLLSEMQAIAERDYGWVSDDAAPSGARKQLTQESICQVLESAGFDLEHVMEVSHDDSAESQRAWLSIPIFTRDRLGGLSYQDRMRVLDKAYECLGPGQNERASWLVFAARPLPSPARQESPWPSS